MKKFAIILITHFIFSISFAQSKKEERKSEKREHQLKLDSITAKVERVQYADLSGIATYQEILFKGSNMPYGEFYLGLRDFVTTYLKLKIPDNKELIRIKGSIDSSKVVFVYSGIGEFDEKLGAVGNYPFTFGLKFSDGSDYSFVTKLPINGYTNFRTVVYNTCQFQFPITVKR